MKRKHRWLINEKQDKAISFHKNGWHRVYSNRRRKGTRVYPKHRNKTYEEMLDMLFNWGYVEVNEEEFAQFFKNK